MSTVTDLQHTQILVLRTVPAWEDSRQADVEGWGPGNAQNYFSRNKEN